MLISSQWLGRRKGWLSCLVSVGFGLLAGLVAARAVETPPPAAAILQQLQSFREMGSVLYVAAHPDDENTLLIAYLARGRNYRTAYLSLTRGDGGQNVLGPEFGEELGVARTQELLAARRLDGGRQFFSRAIDFGYSKDYRETLNIWDKHQVLSDVVRVIREFRPDVVIVRFSPQPGGTHGHHTASTVLALEAFKLAGDTNAFPDQLRDLTPWQPKRILWNSGGFQRGGTGTNAIRMEITGNDPVSGESFAEVAARSRAMHKTQGFDNFRGFGGGGGPRTESFQTLDGEPATNDILEGIDTTWNRVPGGAEIGKMADEVIARFDPANPSASAPALLELRSRLTALPFADPLVVEKRAQLDRILQTCLGLEVETTISNAEVVPGEEMKLHHSVVVHSDIPVRWLGVRYPGINVAEDAKSKALRPNQPASRDSAQTLPANTLLSQPYWLREEGTPGMFRVDDTTLIGRPENPPVFPVEQIFEVGGQTLVVPDEPVQIKTNTANQKVRRRLDVIPPVSLGFDSGVRLFAPGQSRRVKVEITAYRTDVAGTVQLQAPTGWAVAPTNQTFHLAKAGDHKRCKFTVTAPADFTTGKIIASAEIGGVRYQNERKEINYPHIPLQLLQPTASLKAVSLNLAIRGRKIGYLPGAGDSVADSLKQMGCSVTILTDVDLTPERLRGLDAVVIGVRAFDVRTNLEAHLPGLFTYVEAGGTVVEQYNRPENSRTLKLAPYDLHLSGDRVTDENATVTFLAPDQPVLNTPNKITAADFTGWVQERGIYFPNQWDERFTPILACSDPDEAPLKGGLLVAPYGKGHFVYTSLVFFRQLPAGVPGAYRLFANLISLGK
ncbi:MAG: PIG-L family deacetylase [Limisphaerales bacterium]